MPSPLKLEKTLFYISPTEWPILASNHSKLPPFLQQFGTENAQMDSFAKLVISFIRMLQPLSVDSLAYACGVKTVKMWTIGSVEPSRGLFVRV
jgi:hypothetical protein